MLPTMWRRPWEALVHLMIALAVITQYVLIKVPKLGWLLFSFHCAWIVGTFIGAKLEGLRMSQLLNSVFFTIWSLFYFIVIAVKRKPNQFHSTSITNSILTGIVLLFWL